MRSLIVFLVIVVCIAGFVGLWASFVRRTWRAEAPVTLDSVLVGVANTLTGLLGTAFAVALGIDKTQDDQETVHGPFDVGDIFSSHDWVESAASAAILAYFFVGVAVLGTWLVKRTVAPEPVKNFATLFTGYLIAVLTVALS